jgi:hypothetical protein
MIYNFESRWNFVGMKCLPSLLSRQGNATCTQKKKPGQYCASLTFYNGNGHNEYRFVSLADIVELSIRDDKSQFIDNMRVSKESRKDYHGIRSQWVSTSLDGGEIIELQAPAGQRGVSIKP